MFFVQFIFYTDVITYIYSSHETNVGVAIRSYQKSLRFMVNVKCIHKFSFDVWSAPSLQLKSGHQQI